jgi:tRNA A37 methylthiotransferase MiaB
MANQIITFGCRLNSYESEVIKNKLEGKGVDDFIIFNTCAVTKEAENKAKQSIRKFRRANPNKKIVVTGCSAQINPKQYEGLAEVDLVIGNEEKFKQILKPVLACLSLSFDKFTPNFLIIFKKFLKLISVVFNKQLSDKLIENL